MIVFCVFAVPFHQWVTNPTFSTLVWRTMVPFLRWYRRLSLVSRHMGLSNCSGCSRRTPSQWCTTCSSMLKTFAVIHLLIVKLENYSSATVKANCKAWVYSQVLHLVGGLLREDYTKKMNPIARRWELLLQSVMFRLWDIRVNPMKMKLSSSPRIRLNETPSCEFVYYQLIAFIMLCFWELVTGSTLWY